MPVKTECGRFNGENGESDPNAPGPDTNTETPDGIRQSPDNVDENHDVHLALGLIERMKEKIQY